MLQTRDSMLYAYLSEQSTPILRSLLEQRQTYLVHGKRDFARVRRPARAADSWLLYANLLGRCEVQVEAQEFRTSFAVQVSRTATRAAKRSALPHPGTPGCHQGHAIDHERPTVSSRSISSESYHDILCVLIRTDVGRHLVQLAYEATVLMGENGGFEGLVEVKTTKKPSKKRTAAKADEAQAESSGRGQSSTATSTPTSSRATRSTSAVAGQAEQVSGSKRTRRG